MTEEQFIEALGILQEECAESGAVPEVMYWVLADVCKRFLACSKGE